MYTNLLSRRQVCTTTNFMDPLEIFRVSLSESSHRLQWLERLREMLLQRFEVSVELPSLKTLFSPSAGISKTGPAEMKPQRPRRVNEVKFVVNSFPRPLMFHT